MSFNKRIISTAGLPVTFIDVRRLIDPDLDKLQGGPYLDIPICSAAHGEIWMWLTVFDRHVHTRLGTTFASVNNNSNNNNGTVWLKSYQGIH